MHNRLSEAARSLPDTDWHVPKLYEFAHEMGAGILCARFSRYAIDLNRPPDDAPLYQSATTGLYPGVLFDGSPLFQAGAEPDAAVKKAYLSEIWLPYHARLREELDALKSRHGHVVLLDAHSILGVVPRLFEGELPDFNLGTNNGASCGRPLQDAALLACRSDEYRTVLNGRFKGGYITRHYGRPDLGIHAIQLELAQRTYMIERPPFAFDLARARRVRQVLVRLIQALVDWRA
jgi:formiminoglutamase